ncbi:MAG: hypothetical protein PWQ67_940 [Clostridia bacterium]|jgi:nicotinate-nucleotide pyrophosphorylase (carboxylating)|nr:hypothetical protein [Clostridia bacterium]MDN5322486.1 hypothetical protein [Clostridia bacterium]
MQDLRDVIFAEIIDKKYTAQITAEKEGIIAGSKYALQKLLEMGIKVDYLLNDGEKVYPGALVVKITGNPKQITMAEEVIIGKLAKTSGIATAANYAVKLSRGKCRIASGAWKKMPIEIKEHVRDAIVTGGATTRLFEQPFVYLDKNYVRIFGNITKTLEAAQKIEGYLKVIQLKGETGPISTETKEAVEASADVVMIDTGKVSDAKEAIKTLYDLGVREDIKVAFAKGVQISDIPLYVEMGIDLLCIGKQIVDAPLLDMKLDIVTN